MAWVHTPGGWHSELTMICFHIQFDYRQQKLNTVFFSGHGVLFFLQRWILRIQLLLDCIVERSV